MVEGCGAGGRRRAMMVWAAVAAAMCLCWVPGALALDGVRSTGGTYRFGHIHWKSTGSVVEFTVEAGFTRRITDISTWKGTAPDGLAHVGDVVVIPGRQPPQFYFGDGTVEETLAMKVTAISVAENWVLGSLTLKHEYSTTNNGGEPWYAYFTGCCRHASLDNNKDAEWLITAAVDLNLANSSPRANVLPAVTVPLKLDTIFGKPTVYIPADDAGNVEFRVGKPWQVGNAAVFKSAHKSFMAVPLRGMSQHGCTTTEALSENNYAGPGCLFRALRTDSGQKAMTVEGWVLSDTDAGGYVLTVGADNGHLDRSAGYSGPRPDVECEYGPNPSRCTASPLMIKVNKTHVIVGHEVYTENNDDGVYPRNETAFEICSNSFLLNDPENVGDYLCRADGSAGSETRKSATGKWFHLAVVRFQHRATGSSGTNVMSAQVSYKVLVNGRALQVADYSGGTSKQREGNAPCGEGLAVSCSKCTTGCKAGEYCNALGECTACAQCQPSVSFRFGCRGTSAGTCEQFPDRFCESGSDKCFENGESNLLSAPVLPSGNSSSEGVSDYAKGAALVFGAYKGRSVSELKGAEFFDGALDEWRIWNGVRSDSAVLNNFRRIMSLSREQFYGDPSDPERRVTEQNYLVSAVLMASWGFDQECLQVGTTGCALNNVDSVYPKKQDARLPTLTDTQLVKLGIEEVRGGGKALYKAYAYKTTTGETDETGRMYYSLADGMEIDSKGKLTLHTQKPGDFQAVVLLSKPGRVATVPVDFMIRVLPAECRNLPEGIRCALCDITLMTSYISGYTCPFDRPPNPPLGVHNKYMPLLMMRSSFVEAYSLEETSGNAYYLGAGAGAVKDLENSLYPYHLRMYAGFELKLELHGDDPQPTTDTSSEHKFDYTYTKVGFTLGRMPETARFTTVRDTNPSQMDMTWTPCSADVRTHTLCFDAVDSHQAQGTMGEAARPFAPQASSEQRCIVLVVEKEPAPKFETGSGATPSTPQMYTMGQRTQLTVRLSSPNCQANMTVGALSGTQLPEGATVLRGEKKTLQHGTVSSSTCVTEDFSLVWTPSYTQGGFNQTVCLEANSLHSDTCADTAPAASIHCINLLVRRCRYAMQVDQQLQEIANIFNVDWMRLWSLNADLTHPDYIIYGGQTIMIGHLYRALPHEMPLQIAKRMGMPEEQMRALNHGLDVEAELELGDQLCVVPNSCQGGRASSLDRLQLQSLSSFLGRTVADVHPIPAHVFLDGRDGA